MNDGTTLTLSASPANDNGRGPYATAPGVVGGIKSLLCDACGEKEAGVDGYCPDCIADANRYYDERRGDWKGDRF